VGVSRAEGGAGLIQAQAVFGAQEYGTVTMNEYKNFI